MRSFHGNRLIAKFSRTVIPALEATKPVMWQNAGSFRGYGAREHTAPNVGCRTFVQFCKQKRF